ncbi:MAG TPA: hypothetical protein VI076_15485 [Actinopolymorphaceae bacterium]
MAFRNGAAWVSVCLVRRVVWELAADEKAASWREEELIFALRPPFNAGPDLRVADPVRKDVPVSYLVVTEVAPVCSASP